MGNDNSYYNQQNVVRDINRIWRGFADDIETYRSFTPREVLTRLTSIDEKIIDNAAVTADPNPQESYCNCFYRLLGLPIISSDGLYSPGYTPDLAKANVRVARYRVANKIPQPIFNQMRDREEFPHQQLAILQAQDANSSALSLLQVATTPTFNPIKTTGGLDADPQSLPYSITENIKKILQGNVTIPNGQFKHILKPFFSDPRTDFRVLPDRAQICVPFLSDNQRRSSDSVQYNRPLIENVCRVRLSVGNQDDVGVDLEKTIQQIQSDQNFTDQTLVQLTTDITGYFQSDSVIRRNLFNLMDSVIDILADSYKTIGTVYNKINWIPMPAKTGVQDGFTTIPYPANTDGQTALEHRASFLQNQSAVANSAFNLIQRQIGNTSFSEIGTIAFGGVMKSIPTIYERELSSTLEEIQGETSKAEDALWKISIITGQTIGIGLIDMIAIYTALWTIPKEYLVDMMDNDSFDRMFALTNMRSETVVTRKNNQSASIHGSVAILERFETEVVELLNYCQKTFDNKYNNV